MHKNNFDLLRLFLAVWVAFQHSYLVGLTPIGVGLGGIVFDGYMAVQCFFVISGFLIFQSWEKSATWRCYFSKRVRRIYPAYFTVVVVMAACGILLTSLSPAAYLASDGWIKYLLANLAFLNFLQPTLPGVFDNAGESIVNGPLWTIKIEVMFYASVPFLALVARRFGLVPVMLVVYVASVIWAVAFDHLHAVTGKGVYETLGRQLPGQMSFFAAGGLLYYLFDAFKRAGHRLALLAVLVLAAHSFVDLPWLFPAALAILVVYIAGVLPYLGNFGRFGDMSYGVYIFHFPVLQTVATLGLFASPGSTLAAGMAMTFLLAWLSWHLIEKPALLRTSHYRIAESPGEVPARQSS